MSDPEIVSAAQSEQESVLTAQQIQDQHASAAATKVAPGGVSFSIWPPTQRTRDAVVNRLIETLSTPSILSKRYGTISAEEASAAAHQIEDEAYTAACGTAASDNDDGIEILQVYSKEISKRMLDTVKAKGNAGSTVVDNGDAPAPPSEVASADAEGAPSAESQT